MKIFDYNINNRDYTTCVLIPYHFNLFNYVCIRLAETPDKSCTFADSFIM